jgi:N-hydroxyarylamine O-acetyltransferase
MLAVPFENLDIPLGIPIELSLPAIYDKIVRRRRGGFCYELNGLFGWLLQRLGFKVSYLSGRVHEQGVPGPEFDHLLLLVDLGERWIADVGFGDSSRDPLPLDEVPGSGRGREGAHRIDSAGSTWTARRRSADGTWEDQYSFTLIPRQLSEFSSMCSFHQTSPESTFCRRTICTRATTPGRVTLANNRLIETTRGRREEREIHSPDEYREVLRARFDIVLDERSDMRRLMRLNRTE